MTNLRSAEASTADTIANVGDVSETSSFDVKDDNVVVSDDDNDEAEDEKEDGDDEYDEEDELNDDNDDADNDDEHDEDDGDDDDDEIRDLLSPLEDNTRILILRLPR